MTAIMSGIIGRLDQTGCAGAKKETNKVLLIYPLVH